MRVLHLMAGTPQGGAELFFERLVTGLHQKRLPQHLVIRSELAREKRLRGAGLSLTTAPFWKPYLDLKTHWAIHQAIRSFKPDIVMAWMSRAGAFCPKGKFATVGRLGGYYALKYYKNCQYLVGNTEGIRNYFLENAVPEDRAFYLPNFVREEKAHPVSRETWGTPKHVPLLLALGRLHQDKAFDVLIKALTDVPEAYLWIGGAGPEESALKSLATTCGVQDRIRFLGWVEDPYPFYAAADVYVCPSRIEPLGNVVLEAWVNEKPVVVCASKGPAELIQNEENGLIVSLEDASALARALNRVIGDPTLASALVAGGLKTYHSLYSQERVVETYVNFFDHILQRG